MGRLAKIKRELIQEANRELLTEAACACTAGGSTVMTCWTNNSYGACCSHYYVHNSACCSESRGGRGHKPHAMCNDMHCGALENTTCFDNVVNPSGNGDEELHGKSPDLTVDTGGKPGKPGILPGKSPIKSKSSFIKLTPVKGDDQPGKSIQESNRELLKEGKTCWYRNPHGSKPKCKATWEGSGSHGDKCMTRGRCLSPRGGDSVVHTPCGDGGYCLTSQNCASNEGSLKKYSRCFQNCCIEKSAGKIKIEESDNDGDVTNYRLVNKKTGDVVNVDRNHETIKGADLTKARKGKQLTKGGGAQTLNEGILCCALRRGCCEWEQNYPDPHTTWNPDDKVYNRWAGYVIEWNACCGNSRKGRCC